ncbi:hypothetical protein Tco_0104466 [Tanacetum coccineum]
MEISRIEHRDGAPLRWEDCDISYIANLFLIWFGLLQNDNDGDDDDDANDDDNQEDDDTYDDDKETNSDRTESDRIKNHVLNQSTMKYYEEE